MGLLIGWVYSIALVAWFLKDSPKVQYFCAQDITRPSKSGPMQKKCKRKGENRHFKKKKKGGKNQCTFPGSHNARVGVWAVCEHKHESVSFKNIPTLNVRIESASTMVVKILRCGIRILRFVLSPLKNDMYYTPYSFCIEILWYYSHISMHRVSYRYLQRTNYTIF